MALTPEAARAAVNAAKVKQSQAEQAYRAADPQGAMAEQVKIDLEDLNRNYIAPMSEKANRAYQDCLQAGRNLHAVKTVAAPSNLYKETLEKEADHLTKEQAQLAQKIRTRRRSFLDSRPDSGTGAFGTSHTEDDSAMFFLLLGVAAVYFVAFFKVLPAFSYKVVASIVGFVLLWYIVNQAIMYLG
jgi:hypothetical protein